MSQLSKAYEKNKKVQQSIASNLQEDEPKKQLTTVSMTSSKQQLKQVLQEQKQREKNPVQRKNTKIGASQSPKFVSTTFISPVQPIVRTQPSSNLQRLLAQVETGDKWYSGDKPTRSEAAARIYTISQTDPERARKLNQAFSQLQRDPSSQFYNPYGAATNKAIQELANLGVDMSGGITEDWLAKNSWLKAYYRTSGNSGTPLAPTKSSTAEQNAAYYYYQILKAQDTTNQAEAEWKALQEEIGYWANRKDRNYSDDQIISRIDWSKYKTLARMDDGAASGVPLTLNSAIGYSQDALKGVIWAARNGSTGNPLADSAKAVLGAGKTWQEDKKISAKLDPSSKAYSPYSVGSTLDDAALYFGVDSFSKDWLKNNRNILAGNDATAKKMYQTVYNAEQTTLKAEQELDELHASIDRYLESTTDPDQILRMIDGEYKTLDSLDESMREGKLIGTTRAIDYRKQDIEFEVRRRCLAKNTQINGAEYVGAVWKLLGLPEVKSEAGSAVGASRDNAINAGGATIADAGTDEEKTVFKTAYSSDFDTYLTQIKGAMDSGVSDPQGGYDYTLKRADQYAAENYMDAMDTVLTYEEAKQAKDEAIKKLNDLGVVYDEDGNIDMTNRKGSLIVPGADTATAAAGMSDAPRKLRKTSDDTADEIDMLRKEIASGYGKDEKGKRVKLTDAEIELKHSQLQALLHPEAITATQKEINQLLAVVDESTETMERTQKSYDKANITLKNITEGYAVADRMQALTGVKAGDSDSTLAQMTYLFSIARNYEPTEYRSANLYALAMDGQGATYEETAAAAKQGMAENKQMIEQINFALGELESKGAHLPDDKMENVKRYVAALERDVQDAEYFLLRENDDYYQESQDVSNEIFAAWQDYNELNPLGMLNPFADRKGYTALDNVVAIRLEQLQMEEASKTVGRNLKSDKVIMSTGNPAQDGYYTEDINQLSKNECMTYLYIRGKEGVDAAQEYYDHLTNAEYGVINMRRNLDWTAKAKEFADQNAVTGALASALTVIASPLNVGGMVESIKADVLGQDLNPYARGFVYGNMSSTARATVEENISESVGGGAGGWLLGKLYETLMSFGDSRVSSYFMGGLGSAAGSGAGKLLAKTGLTENYVKLASNVVSSFVTASGQGMQAVGNAMMDAKLRGATPAEARVLGLVTFLAETATEAIEVETIDSAIHGGAERKFKDTFKKLLFNMFNEGAGEGVSELVEGMADKVVMDYKSNWAESVQRYIDEGMTKKQAEDAAWKEILWNAAEAAAVGGISGGLGTGLGYVQGRIFGDGSQTQDAVQPTAETVQQEQQAAQETVQQTAQEQTQQEAPTIAQETQNAEVENVAPETAEAAQTPNTKEETQPFDTGERLTQYEVNEKTVRQVTALTASLEADEASQTATIGAALLGDNATPQETAFASAAAQHMTDTLGSDAAVRFTRDVLLLDSDTNGVRAALTVAALNKGGNASQVAQRMAQEGVTAEGIQELKAAADLDMQDANVTAQMQQTVQENQVALRTAQLIGDGALKAVQPYETAVAQAKSALRQAQGELRRQVKRLEGLGQNLLSLQEQINSGTATPQLLDTFRSTVKDIEGQMKVVNEYTQRVANAEQSLHDAQNQLDTVRDDTLRQVRQQAQQDVADMQEQQLAEQEAAKAEQVQQAEAQEKTGYQKKQFIPYDGSQNVNTENISNLESLNDANVPPATPTQDSTDTQNDSGEKYRQFGTHTAQSTDALFQETRDHLLHNSVYEADSNTEQIDRSIDWVRGQATSNDPTGYFAAKSAVLDPSFDYASADGQARMLTVMQMSILMGDAQGQVQIADIFNRQGTSLAQALQARKIFYMMSPAAQAASIQKIANNLSQENGVTVTVPQDALDRLSQAKTMDEAQKIKNQIVRELYQQLPANWKSRLNGLRYLAMLSNPRTHIRNILGNTIMQGMAYVRDKINAALERFFLPQEERTKSFKTKKEYRDAAKALYAEFSSLFDGNAGKYNPEMNRRSFNTQWLQKLADLNTNLLDKEDIIAMSRNFIHYLAGFMQARGWDVNNLTDAQKQEAVQYAFTNAEKNVYHQASKLAEWLNKLGRDKDSSVFDKLGHMVIEGVLPFKKTPINILKTGIEYSPIGLINSMTRGLYQMNQYRQTNGKKGISTAQFLQNLSSGLTGSGLMGVGALMMANGLLRVGFKDKDPEDEYARLTGSQEFSIELFGHSYTIDWTAPSSIPLFMGAAMYKEIENRDEGLTWGNAFDVFMSTISATAEPMLNMTMLDGVNSTIQSVAYANATGSSVGDIIMQSLLNLSTQLVPTSLGAVARTIDPVRRKTYADKNLNIPTWLQYPLERVQNKLPGLSQLNMPYLNAWGEEDREDNLLMRIFENFLSPGYVSKTEADSVETELRDISVRTGTNLIPDLPNQSFSFNNEKINLTAEQYEQYVKTRGSLMHTELERLFATDEYKAMSLGAQASCIKNIRTWADEQGKVSVYPEKTIEPKWMDTKDIVPAVIERRASEDRQAYQNEAYSNIQNAIDNDDAATARDWVYALNQAGVENSDIKEKMTTLYKSEYQYAIRSGDRETARKIEGMLLAMDIGYKAKNFISWEKDAYKEE